MNQRRKNPLHNSPLYIPGDPYAQAPVIDPDADAKREMIRMINELGDMPASSFQLKELMFIMQPNGRNVASILARIRAIYNRVKATPIAPVDPSPITPDLPGSDLRVDNTNPPPPIVT